MKPGSEEPRGHNFDHGTHKPARHVPISHHFEKSLQLEFTYFHTFRGEEKRSFIFIFIYLMSFLQTIEFEKRT
jgi:hypothetical protein